MKICIGILEIFYRRTVDSLAVLGHNPFVRGGVAQLGERLNGIQEAVSSILSTSTRNFKGLQHDACKPFFVWAI